MAAKGQTKYKETMPAQLIKLFEEGKGREDFCVLHKISETTFDLWLAKYPELVEAYEIARAHGKAYYMRVAREQLVEYHEGSKLNTKLWSMIMRNRFDLTEHRKLKMLGLDKAKTAVDQMQIVMAELASGNLTGDEAQHVAKLIATGVTVYEATELEKRVTEIENANKLGVADGEFVEE